MRGASSSTWRGSTRRRSRSRRSSASMRCSRSSARSMARRRTSASACATSAAGRWSSHWRVGCASSAASCPRATRSPRQSNTVSIAGPRSPASSTTAACACRTTPPSGRYAASPSAAVTGRSQAPTKAVGARRLSTRWSRPQSSTTSTRRPGSPMSSHDCRIIRSNGSTSSCPGIGNAPARKRRPRSAPPFIIDAALSTTMSGVFTGCVRSTLSWCRRTRISASNAARDRNSPIKAHPINLQRSLIRSKYQPIRGRWSAVFRFAVGTPHPIALNSFLSMDRFRIRRVRTEPIMYVGNGQPRFREGKGLFFKSRGFVGYLHKYKRVTPTIIGKLHVTHPSNERAPLSIVFDCGNRCPLGGSARIPRFDRGLVIQNHVQQGIMDFQFSVVFDETQFAEFVHEKAHARSGRADHLRQRFLTERSHDRLRPAFLAEICKEKEKPGEALFARIEQLVDQVLFNSTVPSQQIRHEQFRKFRLIMNGGDHGRLL